MMAGKHCALCGGFLDRAGRCGTRLCGNFRGRPKPQRPTTAARVEAPSPLTPFIPAGSRLLTSEQWEAAASAPDPVSSVPIPDCPECHRLTLDALGLGFHVCPGGDAGAAAAKFWEELLLEVERN